MIEIELIVYVVIASMMVVCLIVLKNSGIVRKSDYRYFYVLLFLILTQIVITITLISSQKQDSNPTKTAIYLAAVFALTLIYIITRITVPSLEIQEDARVWIGWTMFLVLAAGFCALSIKLPDTKTDLYRMPLAMALCVGMLYYPPVFDRLSILKRAAGERRIEDSIEGHKESVMNLAIESWRFAKDYERMLTRINTKQTKRYESKLQQFIEKAEESLSGIGLRVVNVEGYPYDRGMAATPLNIEDFEPDDQLVVDQMLEPIIMEGTVLAKTGTVILRRKE